MARPLKPVRAAERPATDARDPGAQRIRVGVLGLAAVFLLTLLAAATFALLGPDQHPTVPAGRTPATRAEDAPKEPLAELGVAPGNSTPRPADRTPRPTH